MGHRGITFACHVRPGGRRDEVTGAHDGALAVRVAAPPVDGRANDAVRRVLAAAFEVAPSKVEVVAGRAARRKRVRVDGDPARLEARLAELMER